MQPRLLLAAVSNEEENKKVLLLQSGLITALFSRQPNEDSSFCDSQFCSPPPSLDGGSLDEAPL
jgi:hypothetical protein